jgi:hypothetical protein
MPQPTIYGLYDPSVYGPPLVRYVGYTAKGPEFRLIEHLAEAAAGDQTHRHKWIRALTRRGIRPAVLSLEDVTFENWQERERAWIASIGVSGRLTNATVGGEGLVNPSAEVRAAIGAKVSVLMKGNQYRKGVPFTEECKARMSISQRTSEKVRAKNSAKAGKPISHLLTPEAKEKSVQARIGKPCPWSREAALKMTEQNRGTIWINNGKQNKRHRPGDAVPDGWAIGPLPFSEEQIAKRSLAIKNAYGQMSAEERKAKARGSTKNLRWITDGETNHLRPKSEPLPQGWRLGQTKRS